MVLVTFDFTVPPPTTTAPFTSMVLAVVRPRLAFEPAEKIVPATAAELDADNIAGYSIAIRQYDFTLAEYIS